MREYLMADYESPLNRGMARQPAAPIPQKTIGPLPGMPAPAPAKSDPWARLNFNPIPDGYGNGINEGGDSFDQSVVDQFGHYGSMADGGQIWGKYGSRSGVFANKFDASPFIVDRQLDGDGGWDKAVIDQAGLDAAKAAFRPSYTAKRRREGAGKYDYETASYGLQADPATGQQSLAPTSGWSPYSEKSSWMQNGPDALKFIAASALGGLGVAGAAGLAGGAGAGAGAAAAGSFEGAGGAMAAGSAGAGAAGAGAGAGLGAFEGIGGAMATGGAPMTAAEFTAGLAGGGGAAAEGLAGLGELGINTALPASDVWGATLADSLGGMGLENVGAAAGEVGAGEASLGAFEGIGGNMAAGGAPMTAAEFAAAAAAPGSAAGAYTTAAADSQAANLAMQAAGTPTGAAIAPSAVDLGSLGGIQSTSGGWSSSIADALQAAKSGASSVADFAKANPRLASLGVSGLTTLLNDSGGSPPAIPGSGPGPGPGGSPGSGSGSGGTNNDALIKALTDKLYGPDGSMSKSFDYSSVPGLKTSAGEVGQFNQQASDAAYSNATRYLDPQIAQQQQALEARLSEQGFVPGTPGYKQAMQNFMDTNQRAYASARDTATLQGFSQGDNQFRQSHSNATLNNSASREQLAQLLAQRNQPLNELSALKTGQQLGYDRQQQNYTNQMDQYNAGVASKNSTNQALSQLALALGIYLG